MNNEKHCSVIDAEGKHVTYVLVKSATSRWRTAARSRSRRCRTTP
ncbi:MAG: hypothetical protein ACLR4Z_08150 [Butyricicoccaceae bacterium]